MPQIRNGGVSGGLGPVWPRGEIRGHILDDLAGGDIIGMKVFQRFHGAEVITMDFFFLW